MVEENSDVAESVFAEMETQKEQPAVEGEQGVVEVEEGTSPKRALKIERKKIIEEKKSILASIKEMKQNVKDLNKKSVLLREKIKAMKSERKERIPKEKLTPEQKRVQQAKRVIVKALNSIHHFRDREDLQGKSKERAMCRYGREATETAIEELKTEGTW